MRDQPTLQQPADAADPPSLWWVAVASLLIIFIGWGEDAPRRPGSGLSSLEVAMATTIPSPGIVVSGRRGPDRGASGSP